MEDVDLVVATSELAGCVVLDSAENTQRGKNLKILQSFAARQSGAKAKKLHLRFLVSPTEVIADAAGNVAGIVLEKNRLEIQPDGTAIARGTGEIEVLDVGMVLPAIGFAAERISGIPYDEKSRVIANEDGRVVDPVSRAVIANEYVVGWARTGPQGLIGSHKGASAHVVEHMIADGARLEMRALPDRDALISLLRERGSQIVSFNDWKQLDDIELARGELRGAPRDKIVDVKMMLAMLGQG
jgi:ferredoxin--NADP+ reductase